MGIKVSLFDNASAVKKTEFTLNDDDYVDIDDDDYIILDNNYKDKIKPEMIVVDIINEDQNKDIIDNLNEKIVADNLVDDIISNVVYDITTNKKNKKNKKKKRKNIW
jgi:hypothetical protein